MQKLSVNAKKAKCDQPTDSLLNAISTRVIAGLQHVLDVKLAFANCGKLWAEHFFITAIFANATRNGTSFHHGPGSTGPS